MTGTHPLRRRAAPQTTTSSTSVAAAHPNTAAARMTAAITGVAAVAAVAALVALAGASPAAASELVLAQAPASFEALITNLRNWIVGLLVGLATLFVTVGGIRLLAADGDPGEVERAKRSIRNGLVGYGLAALAPMIITVLRSLVG